MKDYVTSHSVRWGIERGLVIPEIPLDKDGNPVIPDPRYERAKRRLFYRFSYVDEERQKHHIVEQTIMSERGRVALAQALISPIKLAIELKALGETVRLHRKSISDIYGPMCNLTCDNLKNTK